MSNLASRILTALIALPLLFWSIWVETPYFFIAIILAATLLGLTEYHHLVQKLDIKPVAWVGFLGLVGSHALFFFGLAAYYPALIAVVLALLMLHAVFTERDFKKALPGHAATLFGVLYLGALLGFLIAVKRIEPTGTGSRLLTLFLFIVMAGDVFAYFAGRALGRHKLAPAISPGKTIEGSIGGVLGSVGFAVLSKFWYFPALPLAHAIGLAVIMNAIGQIGDLYESLLKRGSDTKDAASVLPGHGGFLDRLDSLLFNAPVLYYYAVFFLKG